MVNRLSQIEAKRELDRERNIILVDVRNPEEYGEGHIPGARLIPLNNLEMEAEEQIPDKNAKIFVYCQSGKRSAAAGRILAELGYSRVCEIGGIATWPYEIEKGIR